MTIDGPFIEYMGALIAPCEITCKVVQGATECHSKPMITALDFISPSTMMTLEPLTRVSNYIVEQRLDYSLSYCPTLKKEEYERS